MSAIVVTVVVMDHNDTRFTKQNIKREIRFPCPGVASSKDRKVAVIHYCHVPVIRNRYRSHLRVDTERLRVDDSDEPSALEHPHRGIGKHPLRKHHDSIVGQTRFRFVTRHAA